MKILILLVANLGIIGSFYLSTSRCNHLSNKSSTHYSPGELLFEKHCSACHGLDGTKGRFGARNLQKSVLSDKQYQRIIVKGKGIMPSWDKKLAPNEIIEIIVYIKTLKR